jgi:ribonucleotide reductase alpha subunit
MKNSDVEWSNLSKIVYYRTYSRKDNGKQENWDDTIERVIRGNASIIKVSETEKNKLRYFMKSRKATPAGRGLWFSGSPNHQKLGGSALVNCWAFSADNWENLVIAQDLSMLGGGVGLSVEHKFVDKLPRVKKDVQIRHKLTKDADFIVPDSREGWNELTYRILEAFLVTGKSFTFSTICVRGYGEPIVGFGGTSSGPLPLIVFADKACKILQAREGKYLRPIDVVDIFTAIGEMIVSGNVRRSAIILLGDPWDKEYLKAKRWDLGPIPSQRAMANFSVVCDDVEDLHPLFWKTYEFGEPFGIINRTNIMKFGRIGDPMKDTAFLTNPCAEATLESGEACNLQEIALPNIKDEQEFIEAARLMHRYGKRVTCDPFHQEVSQEVVSRNRRIGTGITGCLASPLFNPKTLDNVYKEIQKENESYSKELGISKSIRTTVVKPSGTLSKLLDMNGYEGLHAAYSEYFIQRIRFASNDPLVPLLIEAGHKVDPVMKLDGTLDHKTLVVDFYVKTPDGFPVADREWDTWKQLDVLKMVNEHWSDQSSSVTVYYKKEEIPQIKQWLSENLKYLKTISFLCHSDHGFVQAPKESITKTEFDKLSKNIKDLDLSKIYDTNSDDFSLDGSECAGGSCPIK